MRILIFAYRHDEMASEIFAMEINIHPILNNLIGPRSQPILSERPAKSCAINIFTNDYLPIDQRSDGNPFQNEYTVVRDPNRLRKLWHYTRGRSGNANIISVFLINVLSVLNVATMVSWRVFTINHSSPSFKSTIEEDIFRNVIPELQLLRPAKILVN
jgi:hypothetical protein